MTDAELLQKLLGCFYDDKGELYWSYIESCSVRDVLGKEIEDELKKRITK